MNTQTDRNPSRRDVLAQTGKVAVASALAGIVLPQVHAGEDGAIRLALVGSGSRGGGAVENALRTKGGPLKLVAMADVFEERLASCYKSLKREFKGQIEVSDDRKFIDFNGYQDAMDCLRPGDIVILTTPPAFRWVHFSYAIQKGLNVFMEKPLTVDGPSTRKMLELADAADEKNLKVGVGLMCRHCDARKELFDRIKNGDIGDITMLRAYRQKGPEAKQFSLPKPGDISELLFQLQRFHSFLWASGGCFSDFLIHNIDECCWMKDAWPTHAKGSGGRHYRGKYIDQNFDHYSVEYTFPDGAKLFLEGRNITGCNQEFASYAHGTKGSAVISASGHSPARCRIHAGQQFSRDSITWRWPTKEPSPYQLEWNHLLDAIRQNEPYNEARRGAEASLVTAMGRMAAHTGRVVTWDQMLAHDHELAPDVDKLTMTSPAPVQADKDGKYPIPKPGVVTKREY